MWALQNAVFVGDYLSRYEWGAKNVGTSGMLSLLVCLFFQTECGVLTFQCKQPEEL